MKAVLNEETYVDRHTSFAGVLRNYAWTARGRRVLTGAHLEAMALRSSASLCAINMHVRIAVARAGLARVVKLAEGGPLHFLTLTPAEFAVPLAAAAEFDITGLREWVKVRLKGLNYLGMIDASYISNFAIHGIDATVAWHAHVLMWGVSEKRMKALTDRLNAHWKSLIPGSDVAVCRPVGKRGAVGRWWYLAKAPISESRVMGAGELIDDETGEITAAMRIKDRPLRPGGVAKVCTFMLHRSMPSLFLSGQRGSALRDRILRLAENDLRAARRAEHERLMKVLHCPGDCGRMLSPARRHLR